MAFRWRSGFQSDWAGGLPGRREIDQLAACRPSQPGWLTSVTRRFGWRDGRALTLCAPPRARGNKNERAGHNQKADGGGFGHRFAVNTIIHHDDVAGIPATAADDRGSNQIDLPTSLRELRSTVGALPVTLLVKPTTMCDRQKGCAKCHPRIKNGRWICAQR